MSIEFAYANQRKRISSVTRLPVGGNFEREDFAKQTPPFSFSVFPRNFGYVIRVKCHGGREEKRREEQGTPEII